MYAKRNLEWANNTVYTYDRKKHESTVSLDRNHVMTIGIVRDGHFSAVKIASIFIIVAVQERLFNLTKIVKNASSFHPTNRIFSIGRYKVVALRCILLGLGYPAYRYYTQHRQHRHSFMILYLPL